jgi:hypothetical protein
LGTDDKIGGNNMPIGVIVNSGAVLLGGLLGALLGERIPESLRTSLPLTLGAASMGMGVSYIMKLNTLPVVILALILGSVIGELVQLETAIGGWARRARFSVEKLFGAGMNQAGRETASEKHNEFTEKFVGVLILFCASGTGIFGALKEGMTGDHSILLTKSILDFFTSGIFATSLGFLVGAIFIPQIIILLALFCCATFILPMTTPASVADFTACGGMIMLATGFRISGIKAFPVANMLPALVLVMPISQLWAALMH